MNAPAAAWNPSTNLWQTPGPGHSHDVAHLDAVHPGRESACRLLQAAQDSSLGSLDAEATLAALRALQCLEGPQHGCFRWYLESADVVDTNAAFFTILPLLILHDQHADQLSPQAIDTLLAMFRDADNWFQEALTLEKVRYPNKHLGDLVCLWLIREATGESLDPLLDPMARSADYYRTQHWGWGEHISDCYATVCMDELSTLLLLARKLPDPLRQASLDLLNDLLAIEDAFHPGPRVPTIRSYDMTHRPTVRDYRQLEPASRASDLTACVRHLRKARDWDRLVAPQAARQPDVRIPCFDDTAAVAHVRDAVRLGTMSRYPIMEGIDHHTWGLSWQTMPAAVWRNDDLWAFTQFQTEEAGRVRCHPAVNKRQAYLGNALTDSTDPPVVGRTFSLQQGGAALILRLMPTVVDAWTQLADQWRFILDPASRPPMQAESRSDLWHTLALPHATAPVEWHAVQITNAPAPELLETDDRTRLWRVRYQDPDLHRIRRAAWLWAVNLDQPVVEPPTLTTEGHSTARLTWHWPSITWDILIDLDATQPLRHRIQHL